MYTRNNHANFRREQKSGSFCSMEGRTPASDAPYFAHAGSVQQRRWNRDTLMCVGNNEPTVKHSNTKKKYNVNIHEQQGLSNNRPIYDCVMVRLQYRTIRTTSNSLHPMRRKRQLRPIRTIAPLQSAAALVRWMNLNGPFRRWQGPLTLDLPEGQRIKEKGVYLLISQ